MDDAQNENSQATKTSNKKQIEGTALAVLMENSMHAFENTGNVLQRRSFIDITNRQNNRYQKRNVGKNDPLQTSITDYAVIKRHPSTFEHLRKTTNEENEKSLKEMGLIANTAHSSPRTTSETDIEDEIIHDSLCSIQDAIADHEMYELQKRFNQALGKRFNVTQQNIRKNEQEPVIKRRKEDKEKRLKREAESSKKDEKKENGAKKANENIDYFCKFKYSLVTVKKPNILTAGFACIEKVVLKELLESMKLHEFTKKYALIDCRYPYEYKGGHIKGALNIYDPVVLENSFFPECPEILSDMVKKIPIFYCEYSSARGPLLASHLRKSDRVRNYDKYPFLYYNEIYVLQGGYHSFYNAEDKRFKALCEPIGYITMHDKKYLDEFKIHHTLKRNGIGLETGMFETALIKKNADIRRTNSVPQMPESPTASQFSHVRSSGNFHPDTVNTVPMLANPRTPTGRKSTR
ncbi:Rhodanese-like domain family protein [Acanthocheilonema viteae]